MSADENVEAEPAGMPEQADAQHEPAGMPVQAADQPPDRDDDAGPVSPASDALAGAGASPLDNADSRDAAAPDDNVLRLPGGGSIKLPKPFDPKDPEYVRLQEEEHELRQRAIDAAGQHVANIEKARVNRTRPPQLQSIPQAPQMDFAGASHGFMLAAVALGAFAGARGRSGATGALNAFSAALQGYHKGETEVWAQKSQEWKQQADQAISSNQEKLQQYNAIWKDEQMDLDQKMEEYKIVAGMYNDQISWNLADQRNYTLLGQTFQKDFTNTLNMAEKVANLDRINQGMLDRADKIREQKETQDSMARGLADNTVTPDQISARGDRNQIYAIAKDKYGVNVQEKERQWMVTKKKIQTLNGAQMQRLMQLEGSFKPEFQQLIDLNKQLKGMSNVPVIAHAQLLAWVNESGPKGDLTRAYLAKAKQMEDLVAQIAQGGYAPTESAFGLAHDMFKSEWNTSTLEKVLGVMDQAIDIRIQAIPDVRTLGPLAPNVYTGGGGQPPAGNDGWTVTPVQ